MTAIPVSCAAPTAIKMLVAIATVLQFIAFFAIIAISYYIIGTIIFALMVRHDRKTGNKRKLKLHRDMFWKFFYLEWVEDLSESISRWFTDHFDL